MSKATLIIREVGPRLSQVIKVIRTRTKLPISEIKKKCESGNPICEVDLIDLDAKLFEFKSLITELQAAGATVEIYRLLRGETFENVNKNEIALMNITMLENILLAQNQDDDHYIKNIGPFEEQ